MAGDADYKHAEIRILLPGDWEDNDKRNENIMGDLADWLHERVCGLDHGPKGEDGQCKDDIMLSGRVHHTSEGEQTMKELQEAIYANARAKGFYDKERSLAEALMLMVSELAEALEHYRKGHDPTKVYWVGPNDFPLEREEIDGRVEFRAYDDSPGGRYVVIEPERAKPDGVGIEMADCVIRILDTAEHLGLDLQKLIELKMAYNSGRPYLHGGKKL